MRQFHESFHRLERPREKERESAGGYRSQEGEDLEQPDGLPSDCPIEASHSACYSSLPIQFRSETGMNPAASAGRMDWNFRVLTRNCVPNGT